MQIKFNEELARQLSNGEITVVDGQIVRTGKGIPSGDGLLMHERQDDSGRKIREFTNAGERKVWMDSFKSEGFLQTGIYTATQNSAGRIVPAPKE